MIEIILICASCAYVVAPLFRRPTGRTYSADSKLAERFELIHRKQLIADTIDELNFDHQTGKLSDDDLQSLLGEHQNEVNRIESKLHVTTAGEMTPLARNLEAEIARAKRSSQVVQKKRCRDCGQDLGKGVKYCSNCGRKADP